VTDVK